MTNEQKLLKELQNVGIKGLTSWDLERALKLAGLRLLDEEAYENYSWTVSPDRMGS